MGKIFKTFNHQLLLIGFGFIFFLPGFLSGFVYDDIGQIVKNSYMHHIGNAPIFFVTGIKAPGDDPGFYYRPLGFSLQTVLYAVGGGNPFPFRTFQLAVFLVSMVLVYGFFARFFGRGLALILSITFLVHPVEQQPAVYISNLPNTLCLFFGMLAFLVTGWEIKKWLRPVLSGFFLFLSLLSKEWGLVLIPLVPLYALWFQKTKPQAYIFTFGVVALFYFILRLIAKQQPMLTYIASYVPSPDILERLTLVPTLLYFDIRQILAPTASAPRAHEILVDPPNLFLILTFEVLGVAAVLGYAYYLKRVKKKYLKPFLFFMAMGIVGLLPYLQILPLDLLVSRDWFSLSLLGVLGMAGVFWMSKPFTDRRFVVSLQVLYAFLVVGFAILSLKFTLDMKDWLNHLVNP